MYTKKQWSSDKYYNFKYLEYLPKDYDKNKKYPLVILLHGAGERGEDVDVVSVNGYLRYVKDEGKDYPFIIVSPQCPANKYWGCFTESLLAFFDFLNEDLSVDVDRVYLTGLSMGGTGTWMLSMADPDRFAAIAPVCGTGIFWNGEIIKDLPIFIYHGDCDDVVPINESINMLNSVNSRGGKAKMKICHGIGHNSWENAYTDPELIDWFLSHKRGN